MQFRAIYAVDFEFRSLPGERPEPLCLVAHELRSGRTIRQWANEFGREPPYPTDAETLVIAYFASAEFGCHLALGWPLPTNVVDLYAEFRVETNGKPHPMGSGLLGALAHYGAPAIDALEKDEMRALALRGGPYSSTERRALIDYCESDVRGLAVLWRHMRPLLDNPVRLGHALHRGRYMKAVAHVEHRGIPIDGRLLHQLRDRGPSIKSRLINDVDREYGVYENGGFRQHLFNAYLERRGIDWPRTATGMLETSDDTFKAMALAHPQLQPLAELRRTVSQLDLSQLAVGGDERNRSLISPFRSKTGRNQPSTNRWAFGLPAWMRALIRPDAGRALAYIDWGQQEVGIAAALSGDVAMAAAYLSGDPYLSFARQASLVPADATKASHPRVREQAKAAVLATQYGMQARSLGQRLGVPEPDAKALLRAHERTYPVFWSWSEDVVNCARARGELTTVFGWNWQVTAQDREPSIRNFPMQANGAEMLRLAACLGTDSGIEIVAPVHDAFLIEAPVNEIEAAAVTMQDAMRIASETVLGGFTLRTDCTVVRYPDRFLEARGAPMWKRVNELLRGTAGP